MRQLLLTILTVYLFNVSANAQKDSVYSQSEYYVYKGQSFHKDNSTISLEAGFGGFRGNLNNLGGLFACLGNDYTECINLTASYQNKLWKIGSGNVSFDALLAYKADGFDINYYPYSFNESWQYWVFGLRSSYHFSFFNNPKCDPYAGVMLGFYHVTHSSSTDAPFSNLLSETSPISNNPSNYFNISAYIGFRYFITNKLGFWAELGYGYNAFSLGISYNI